MINVNGKNIGNISAAGKSIAAAHQYGKLLWQKADSGGGEPSLPTYPEAPSFFNAEPVDNYIMMEWGEVIDKDYYLIYFRVWIDSGTPPEEFTPITSPEGNEPLKIYNEPFLELNDIGNFPPGFIINFEAYAVAVKDEILGEPSPTTILAIET